MAQIKAHEFEGVLARGGPRQPVILFYGPDRGLVSERACALVAASGVPDDPFSLVRIDGATLAREPSRLADEAGAIGLFGDKRLIWVRDAGNDRTLTSAVAHLAGRSDLACTIVIEAGDLKKGAALRKAVEDGAEALAVPCYADDARAVGQLVDEELQGAGLRATRGARQMLVESLGGDRLATRGELAKLMLYAHDLDVVDEADIAAILGDAAALSVDDAVDAALTGDLPALDVALQRIAVSKTGMGQVLQSALRQFQLLDLVTAEAGAGRAAFDAAMRTHGRHIHFKRKPAFERAARNWNHHAVQRALSLIHEGIFDCRRRPGLDAPIARRVLTALARRTARGSAAKATT